SGFSERKRAREKLRVLCKKYSLDIDIDKKVKEISHSMRVCTEIMKLLYSDCEILIFDEPTAVLTRDATDSFIKAVRMLSDEGRSIVFITHKLNEILATADRISVLRKGRYVGTVEAKQADVKELSYMMMGETEVSPAGKKKADNSDIILKAENLSVKRYMKKGNNSISFSVRSGEIVALTGVEGNGQDDIIKMLTGEERAKKGSIYLLSKDITECSIGERRRSGISHIPEDREGRGLIYDFSLPYNMALPRLRERIFQKNGFIRKTAVKEYAEKIIRDFDINLKADTEMPVRYLSAGNQQKALLGRELEQNKSFIIAEEPFKGLDAYSAESIYLKFIEKRNEGKGILFVSYDADEIIKLSDRILVIYEGEITGELYPEKITVSELGMYISGAARQQESENL
ncbi:MAG: ATP-binding cassette domain-containing protein, partial [Clostridia bacterium]|nr:ATP-binding cassette domain-containing protein [Clostridia bacterium]